jgi:hypothetical protein
MADPRIETYQADFVSGELSPNLYGQIDFEAYYSGCKTLLNFISLAQGPVSRRAGFVTLAAAKQNSYNIGFLDFVFSTTPSQSYILEIGSTGGGSADGYIRIYHLETKTDGHVVELLSDGTVSTWNTSTEVYDAVVNTIGVPFGNDDIPNLRITQINDILYFVDGVHSLHKLIRSGDTQPGTWEIQEVLLVGETFTLSNVRRYLLYKIPNDVYSYYGTHPADQSHVTGMLDTSLWESVEVLPGGVHDDATWGAAWGTPGGAFVYEDLPDYLSGIFDDGYLAGSQVWAWVMEGDILIPANDTYYFAVNGDTTFDVFVDGKHIAGEYGAIFSTTGANYFAGKSGFKALTGTLHHVKCRLLVNAGLTASLGYSLGWRRGVSVTYNGGAGNGTGVTFLSVTRDWHGADSNEQGSGSGNGIYEIIVQMSPDAAHWGWTYRLNASHPDEESAAWPTITVDGTPNWGDDDPAGWIVKPTDAEGLLLSTFNTNYSLALTDGGQSLATITIPTTGRTGSEYWEFKVGFQIIPASRFTQQDEAIEQTSYPRLITSHEQRLNLAAPPLRPNVIQGSRIRDYENFDQENTTESDPYEHQIASNRVDPLQFLVSGRRLIAGSTSNIYIIGVDDQALSPTYFPAKPHSNFGSAFIQPVEVGGTLVYADRGKSRLWEIRYTIESDSYEPEDLTIRSEHLFGSVVFQLAFQQSGLVTKGAVPTNVIWVVDESGNLYGCTYERKHNVIAWHRHDVGGTVKAVRTLPAASGDQLWLIVRRGSVNYIEYMDYTKLADGIVAITSGDPVTTDLKYGYTGTTVTFKALRFASKKVAIFDSNDDYLVDASGDPINVTLTSLGVGTFTYASNPGTFYVGFCYVSTLEPMPVEIKLSQRETSKNMMKSFVDFWVECLDTEGLTVNSQEVEAVSSATLPASKEVFLPDWDTQKIVTIQQANALPVTITSIHGTLEIHS